ncbi:MAG: N-acetylmuramoyl-L-alanine amidase [Bacteroidia bacterium]|nr:N-acetylmuramoyl-L-alanine amidase [Bacteroidia bacterium]
MTLRSLYRAGLRRSAPRRSETPQDAADLGDTTPASLRQPVPEAAPRSRSLAGGSLPAEPLRPVVTPRYLWCLDNGHGRLQPGKRSPLLPDGSQFEEWSFNRDIVQRIAAQLDLLGIQYCRVVPEDHVDDFLRERVDRANQKTSELSLPKIYVSVHANAAASNDWNPGVRGIEVWHFPGSSIGMRLASAFQAELMRALPGWKDRGIKSHAIGSKRIFYVLRNTQMPAVLTENGFYTDPDETRLLMTSEIRERIAAAHVAAICRIEHEDYDGIPFWPLSMTVGE